MIENSENLLEKLQPTKAKITAEFPSKWEQIYRINMASILRPPLNIDVSCTFFLY